MIPQIISVLGFPINSFGLCVALAIFAASLLMARSFAAFGLPAERAESYVFIGGLTGLLGARLWFLLFNIPMVLSDPIGTIFSSAGFIFYGGFIFAFIVLYLMSRRDKISFLTFLDAAGPSMSLGYAIGRLGCQLSGDGDYGKVTDSIFGMSFHTGVVPTPPGLLVFPTPLYESAICLVILFFILALERRRSFGLPGRWFGVYLLLVSIERFFVEFLRIEPRFVGGLSQAQYIALAFMVCGAALILFRRHQQGS
jgi:phosphatidylglycerol:prolipoprotein diacylglycerol transferase